MQGTGTGGWQPGPVVPKEEIGERLVRLKQWLTREDLDAALVVQRVDLFYWAGTAQDAHLYVPREGEPVLMVRRDYHRALAESPLAPERVVPLPSLRQLPALVREAGLPRPRRLGAELDVLPANQFRRYQEIWAAELVDVSPAIRRLRAVKSAFEIMALKEAAQKHDAFFGYLPQALRPGRSEVEVVADLESFARRQGHLGPIRFRAFNQEMFHGSLLSGESGGVSSSYDTPLGGPGLYPSYPREMGCRPLAPGEPIMADYVGHYGGYMVDASRVYVLGEVDSLPEKLRSAHQVALAIEAAIVEAARPGVSGGELYHLARRMAEEAGLIQHFQGYGTQVPFVGHGVGLEIDELPVLAPGYQEELEPGMVVAVEPKFIFPGWGAVGLEDTGVVTNQGLELLTQFPREIQAVSLR